MWLRGARRWLASGGWYAIPDPGIERAWREPISARYENVVPPPSSENGRALDWSPLIFTLLMVLAYATFLIVATTVNANPGLTRLVVGPGSNDGMPDLRPLVMEFDRKYGTVIRYRTVVWGYCFDLTELPLDAERAFVARVRQLGGNVREYSRCGA